MSTHINKRLQEIEKEYNVEILFACESGSRAYGLDTLASDFDVRFIYKYKASRYLHLNRPQEVINVAEGNYDMQGWDLYKTIYLFTKSNPSLYEWLWSPFVYYQKPSFAEPLRQIMAQSYSLKALGYHYFKILTINSKRNLTSSVTIEDIKVMLQLIRAFLSLKVVVKQRSFPVILFADLCKQANLDDRQQSIIEQFVQCKISGKVAFNEKMKNFLDSIKKEAAAIEKSVKELPEKQISYEDINLFLLTQHNIMEERT
jgi:predicted nucleotidyltransferase